MQSQMKFSRTHNKVYTAYIINSFTFQYNKQQNVQNINACRKNNLPIFIALIIYCTILFPLFPIHFENINIINLNAISLVEVTKRKFIYNCLV